MICQSCQTELKSHHKLCPYCGWNNAECSMVKKPVSLSFIKTAPRVKLPVELDIALLIDKTGSSEYFTSGIKKCTSIILDKLCSKAKTVKTTVITCGDLDCGEESVIQLSESTDLVEIKKSIESIYFEGGGDAAETHLDSIEYALANTPFMSNPESGRGALIAILNGPSKPAHSGTSKATLAQMIKDRGIYFYLISEPDRDLIEVVNESNGVFYPINNEPDEAFLQSIAARLSASIILSASKRSTVPINC